MRRFYIIAMSMLLCAPVVHADEGMWLPSLMGRQIKTMRERGFKLSAEDIYSVNQASLKDAIVQFGGGCTGELVSPQGLLLTNHHCGYSQIQNHSSVERDLLTNGFWAMNLGEELPNPGLKVSFLVKMEDVTAAVLEGVNDSMADSVRAAVVKRSIARLVSEATKGTTYNASVEPLYYGNQYFLFVYETYRDVRLVAAPPSSIGKFGGDTDNWMWPRHTGDFSVFRVYADKDNKPAEYSKDNVPYRPKKHFKISTDGVKQGDFTFVYGYPGRTSQYLVSDAVDYILNKSNPAKISLRTQRLNVIKAEQERDPKTRIMYASKSASIANAWKKWQGESRGIARLGTIDKKRAAEQKFDAWAADKPEYSGLLREMKSTYTELEPYAYATDYHNEAIMAIELVRFAGKIQQERDPAKREELAREFYKDYSPVIDARIALMMFRDYLANTPQRFIPQGFEEQVNNKCGLEEYVTDMFSESKLTTAEGFAQFMEMDSAQQKSEIAVDLYTRFNDVYQRNIRKEFVRLNSHITALYSTYMRALMQMSPNHNFYPDANFTLRVAYGDVSGYKPSDGVTHLPVSTLDGIIEKDNPEIYDYNIPQRLRDIHAAKDYGRWAVDGTVPVAFLATNHTTGGNSGSPVLNARGELVGINFDRTWLSTMSDIEFDEQMCRNIAVDIRYVLFVIDRIGGAEYLLREMGIE